MSDSISVTPGSGVSVATKRINGVDHQRVITHSERKRILVSPAISTLEYSTGFSLGLPVTFADAFRNVGIGGVIEEVSIFSKSITIDELEVIFYTEDLVDPGLDHVLFSPSLEDLIKVQGTVKLSASDFSSFDDKITGFKSTNIPIMGNSSLKDLKAKIIARKTFTPSSIDDIQIGVKIRMD